MRPRRNSWYFNYLYFGLFGGLLIAFFVISYINSLVSSSMWALYGALLWVLILILFLFFRFSPPLLRVCDKKAVFISFLWKHTVIRTHLKNMIIEPTGIIFLPKEEYASEFKWTLNFSEEPYLGYKEIKFPNYKAIGALIEALRPIDDFINMEVVSPKWKDYFQKKLYETEEGR